MTVERCPTCKQIIRPPKDPPTPVRECYDCGVPISGGHRFTYQQRPGIPVPVTVHRICSNPTGYYGAAQCKKIGVVGYKELKPDELKDLIKKEEEAEAKFAAWRKKVGRIKP